jgi:transcriptional/translational regulatory protein YebC/TACO1
VGFLVISLSDNSNRANMAIKAAARKADVKMASGGSVMFQFDHKGILTSTKPYDEDKVIESAIEAGVDAVDFYPVQGGSSDSEADAAAEPKLILTDPESLGALQDALTSATVNMEVQ